MPVFLMMRTIVAGWYGEKLIVFMWGINGVYSGGSDVISVGWVVEKRAASCWPLAASK
jgi:hypothetical protein